MKNKKIPQLVAAIRNGFRIVWYYYLNWPVPLWRLRGYAKLKINGFKFKYYLSGTYHIAIAREFMWGKWEKEVLDLAKKVIKPGDVFIDIGASTGPYTLLASALVAPGGWIYAFEPDPVARDLLERNVKANGVLNVTILPYGVSNQNGSAWLDPPELGLGIGLTKVNPDKGKVKIKTLTLESFVKEQNIRPSVVKIDVEGGESKVLAGGAEVLKKSRVILLEFHEMELQETGEDPRMFFQSLFELEKNVIMVDNISDRNISSGTILKSEDTIEGNVHLALLDMDVDISSCF